MNNLFIVGHTRSGTSLVSNLLNECNHIKVLSQPFTQMFYGMKRTFYEKINHPENDLLFSHFYPDECYTPNDFVHYLSNKNLSKLQLLKWFSIPFEGQYSNFTLDVFDKKGMSGEFSNVLKLLLMELNTDELNETLGFKQVLCEEYIPHLLNNNFKVIHVIRDPRDVVCSAHFGNGLKYKINTVGNFV